MLSDFNYFLRVFELKNKFRQMIIKEPEKKTLLGNYQAAEIKNTTIIKLSQLNMWGRKEKILN